MDDVKVDRGPKTGSMFSMHDASGFIDALIKAGMQPADIQKIARQRTSQELNVKLQEMVHSFYQEDPFLVLRDGRLQWELFLSSYFGFEGFTRKNLMLQNIDFPGDQTMWNIVVPEQMITSLVLHVCSKFFKVSTTVDWTDFNSLTNDRDRSKTYVVAVKQIISSDGSSNFGYSSPEEYKKSKIYGHITLLERLLLELFCFTTRGQHLDCEGTSRCVCLGSYSESRGSFPEVYFRNDELYVGYVPRDAVIPEDNLWSRRVYIQ